MLIGLYLFGYSNAVAFDLLRRAAHRSPYALTAYVLAHAAMNVLYTYGMLPGGANAAAIAVLVVSVCGVLVGLVALFVYKPRRWLGWGLRAINLIALGVIIWGLNLSPLSDLRVFAPMYALSLLAWPLLRHERVQVRHLLPPPPTTPPFKGL